MAKAQEIRQFTENVLADYLTEHGLELYHVDFRKEGKDWYLNVFVDRIQNDPEGKELYVSSDDCERVSRYLSDRLDESDPIQQEYMLMVSSPGMDRTLYEQKQYDRYAGRPVDVKLYSSINKKKEFHGELVGLIDGEVVIIDEDDGETKKFPLQQVVRTSLAVVF